MQAAARAVHRHLIQQRRQQGSSTPATGTAQLTYYIFEGVLAGFIGASMVHLSAWSGGGGGSRAHTPNYTANNPYMYALKEKDSKKHVHGGPIPPGAYQIHAPGTHPRLGLSCRLDPLQRLPNNRSGFYIHGQGPHGSDGCIVPASEDFSGLMEKLKASQGGRLIVCQSMDGQFA